jgi:hypothetical protein
MRLSLGHGFSVDPTFSCASKPTPIVGLWVPEVRTMIVPKLAVKAFCPDSIKRINDIRIIVNDWLSVKTIAFPAVEPARLIPRGAFHRIGRRPFRAPPALALSSDRKTPKRANSYGSYC